MTDNVRVTSAPDVDGLVVLDEESWRPRAEAHARRVDTWTADRLDRAARGRRHPVDDFLFEYYPTRAGSTATTP